MYVLGEESSNSPHFQTILQPHIPPRPQHKAFAGPVFPAGWEKAEFRL